MRGIILFTTETAEAPFAPQVVERLADAEAKRRTLFHLERVRVVIGAAEYALNQEGRDIVWQVPTGPDGGVPDDDAARSAAQQLVTLLYARLQDRQDAACDLIFLSEGSLTGVASVRLARVVYQRFVALYPVKAHLMLLQDQLSPFGDAHAGHMLQAIRQANEERTRFYSSLYLLPWEPSKREGTCATIGALVMVMVIGAENPMLIHQTGTNPMWVETAGVTHLEAPVKEITRVIFQFLIDRFMRQVLEPATGHGDSVLEGAGGVDARARALKDMMAELSRGQRLPPLSELYEIMPAQDPSRLFSEKEDLPSVDTAWREIYRMYGDEAADRLRARLNPDLDQSGAGHADLEAAVTAGLLKQSVGLAAERGLGLDLLPSVIFTLGQRLLGETDKPLAGAGDPPNYKRGLLLSKAAKNAVAVARTRHMCLRSVWGDVRRTYGQRYREARQSTVEHAIADSRHYMYNLLVALVGRFRQRCDIELEQMPTASCYDARLREVYVEWCQRQGDELGTLTAADLYALFTDEVLAMPPEEAAEVVCDRLIARFNASTQAAVDRIRIHIGQFFKEIAFRTSMLPAIGVSENLVSQLIDYMDHQTTVPPLLFESTADDAMRVPKARAFLFHETGGDSSHEFGKLARDRGINVINDPFESGVEMIVKYAGNALDHTLLYINNRPEDAGV